MDLVTLSEYKAYKNISSTEQDSVINGLITRVSSFIKTYCGKTFVDYASVDKVEYFDGVGIDKLFLDEQPVISITSIEISNDGGLTYQTPLVEYTDYFVDYDIGVVSALYSNFVLESTIAQGISNRNVKVTYKGGYTTTPSDIKQAALDLIEYYRNEEYTPRKQFQLAQVDNIGARTGTISDLPAHIARVLSLYREL
jgi:hypothetical protein